MFVGIYTYNVTGEETGNMPSLWSFVLAIAGTVLVLSLLLVVIYRLVLRKRRDQLQRRIAAGQVDVEALALNQTKAPQDVVDKMPLYTYLDISSSSESSLHRKSTSDDEAEQKAVVVENISPPPAEHHAEEENRTLRNVGLRKPQAAVVNPAKQETDDATRSKYRLSHTQTTCAICIDDFVAGSSVVRELPCGHIFDSECIDPFLTDNSCLCPLCKKSVLPAGSYYISVTNEMVQREHTSRQSD